MTLQCPQATEGVKETLLLVTRELGDKKQILKALSKLHTGKTHEAKELCLLEISKVESQVIEQQSLTKIEADAAYDLFCQFLCGKAQTQWNHIIKDM